MYKYICAILFLVSLNLHSFCQGEKITLGFESEPTINNSWGKNTGSKEFGFGYANGIKVEFNFSNYLGLKTGVFVSQFISKAEYSEYIPDSSITVQYISSTLFYLTLPITINYKIKFGSFYLFMGAGVYYSCLLHGDFNYLEARRIEIIANSSKLVFNSNQKEYVKGIYSNTTDNFLKKYDFGLTAGIGIGKYLTQRLILEFELYDNLGLVNISDIELLRNGTLQNNQIIPALSLKFEL